MQPVPQPRQSIQLLAQFLAIPLIPPASNRRIQRQFTPFLIVLRFHMPDNLFEIPGIRTPLAFRIRLLLCGFCSFSLLVHELLSSPIQFLDSPSTECQPASRSHNRRLLHYSIGHIVPNATPLLADSIVTGAPRPVLITGQIG
jgi:hypothetical protein